MALHFYIGGTDGGQDGTEISNGDLSNPLVFDGFNATDGAIVSKTKTIHIRADAGETWYFVCVAACDSDTTGEKSYIFYYNGPTTKLKTYTGMYDSVTGSTYCSFINKLGDTNIPIQIIGTFVGGESSPDSSIKLVVIGGVKA